MDVQIFSDLHLEFTKKYYPSIKPQANILLLLGDIGRISDKNYKNFMSHCSKNWKCVLVVLGNHEYHHGKKSINTLFLEYQEYFHTFKNIHLLDNSSIVVDNIKFIGSTLWSNIMCNTKYLNDFKKINYLRRTKIKKNQFVDLYKKSKKYIINEINEENANKIIILTHFPMINKGVVNEEYENSIDKSYFTNDLIDEIDNKKVIACIHGHTHHSIDIINNKIRFISNAKGYMDEKTNYDENNLYKIDI